MLGVSCDEYRQDGAFAEFVVVPQHILYQLPDKVSFTQAAMVEPLAIAMHAATRAPVRQGAAVLVVGAGHHRHAHSAGYSMGAGTLIAVDVICQAGRSAVNGATHVLNSNVLMSERTY